MKDGNNSESGNTHPTQVMPGTALLRGSIICERFTIEELVGRGGMGFVYRAVDTHTGQKVALKQETLAMLRRIAEALSTAHGRASSTATSSPPTPRESASYIRCPRMPAPSNWPASVGGAPNQTEFHSGSSADRTWEDGWQSRGCSRDLSLHLWKAPSLY
ncbi:hypothetical protein [Cystobacter fuscus]|uniref:hypothetical protein n=1 Tax=Cystobacter fuscus TaxID=43 RepID=UPI0012FD4B50|nr:hypothetical protein [Cystobacter fuscus]